MRIGLIGDLAIGVDRTGSQVGAAPQDFLHGLSIGAPPDAFNPQGQDWGLTTFSPHALIASGFAPFIATLRATMRCCGGLRIDHAMGLMRLWLVPRDGSPTEGAYLAYPFDDLLRLLALESHRNGSIVIGEDLGTVPPEFKRRSRDAGIAGMDVLWFQRDGQHFLPPAYYEVLGFFQSIQRKRLQWGKTISGNNGSNGNNRIMENQNGNIEIQSPVIRRPKGRSKSKRIKSTLEETYTNKTQYKCKNCKQIGHNSKTCKEKRE